MILLAGLTAAGVWFFAASDAVDDWDEVAYQEQWAAQFPPVEAAVDPVHVPDAVDPTDPARTAIEPRGRRPGPAGALTATETARELGFVVRVLVKGSGAPVPRASVYYFDPLSPRYRKFRRARRLYRVDKEAALSRYGERAVADASGVATLPRGIPSQAIAIRHDDMYGELQVSGKKQLPPNGYVVELEYDRALEIHVVDHDGEPVNGTHLAFYIAVVKEGRSRWVLWRDPNRNVRSLDGIQRLPHVQRYVDLLERLSKGAPILHIGLDAPGMTGSGPTVNLRELPEEPLQVVMAEYGKVVVQVTDADGEPVHRRISLSTAADFANTDLAGDAIALQAVSPHWELNTDREGKVTFDKVALGTKVHVESRGKAVTDSERADVEGPARPGQEVVVQFTKPFTAAVIEGVALDEAGNQLAEVALVYRARRKSGASDTEYLTDGTVRTDAIGNFRLRLAPTSQVMNRKNVAVDVNLYSKLWLGIGGGQSTMRAAVEVPLPARLSARSYRVGLVRLRLPELIAAGRVYLDDKPIKFFDKFVLDFRDPANKNRWTRIKDIGVDGKPGGFFEVRGELLDRAVRLRARSWGYLPVAPVMLSRGQRDIDVRLYSAGAFRVSVLYDIETSDAAMEVKLTPIVIDYPEIDNALKWQFVGRVDKRSSGNLLFRRVYWWTGLPPGSYRVELRLLGESRPFVVLDQLKPYFGVATDQIPPEVINLRGVIRRVKIRARDGKGRPIAGMVFPLGQTAIDPNEGVEMGRKGAVLHTTSRGGVDVQVVAKGYRAQTVYGVDGERVVTMRPGIPLTVQIAAPRLPRGVRIIASIRRRTFDFKRLFRRALRNPVNSRSGSRPLTILMGERTVALRYRGKRRWQATLMEPGQFSIVLQLAKKGRKPVRLLGYGPSRVMLRDTTTEQKIAVRVNPRRFNDALKQLGVAPVLRKRSAKKKPAKKRPAKKKPKRR